MRILLLVKRFNYGGAENHVCDLANSLSGAGHDVWIMSGKGNQSARLDSKVIFIPFRFFDFLMPIHCISVAGFIRKHAIEVVHGHQRLPIRIACVAGRMAGVPAIATVHGRTRYDLRRKSTRKKLQGIIYVSSYTLLTSGKYKELSGKTFFIPNGISFFKSPSITAGNRIYYVCRMDQQHTSVISMLMQQVLPRLIGRYPDISLGIIGDGHKVESLRKEATKINASYNKEVVAMIGYQPEVSRNMPDAALVMGVGRVAMESLACGIPVLSLNRLHLGPLIGSANYEEMSRNNFVAIHTPPPLPEKLVGAIEGFMANRSFWEKEIRNIQSRMEDEFALQKVMARTLAVYSSAIKQESSRR